MILSNCLFVYMSNLPKLLKKSIKKPSSLLLGVKMVRTVGWRPTLFEVKASTLDVPFELHPH